jgi:hypothetical protein
MTARATLRGHGLCAGVPIGLALTLAGCSPRENGRQPAPVSASRSTRKSDAVTAPVPSSDCPRALVAARRGGTQADRYVTPSEAERAAMKGLVEGLVRDARRGLAIARAEADALAYLLEDVSELPGVVLLREDPAKRRGGGAYLLRLGATSRLVVQAPHTFFDEGTLPLACELFRASSAMALFVDTAHRYKAAEVDDEGNHPADVAHSPESLFQAATEGLLRGRPDVTVLSLHGFSPRESGAAIVLSSGVAARSGALQTRLTPRLQALVSEPVLRFPDETSELGGTTNVQGRAVRAAGGVFLHVEMSAPLRKALLADAGLRARVLDVFAESAAPL